MQDLFFNINFRHDLHLYIYSFFFFHLNHIFSSNLQLFLCSYPKKELHNYFLLKNNCNFFKTHRFLKKNGDKQPLHTRLKTITYFKKLTKT